MFIPTFPGLTATDFVDNTSASFANGTSSVGSVYGGALLLWRNADVQVSGGSFTDNTGVWGRAICLLPEGGTPTLQKPTRPG